MGCVQQAVLEFDEEVRAPWRPRLVADTGATSVTVRHPSRRAPSRVGVCETPGSPSGAVRRVADRPMTGGRVSSPVGRPARGRVEPSVHVGRVHLRLTRRARRLAWVLALAIGLALGSWLGPLLGGDGQLRLAGDSSVVVQEGDTLWSIASSVAGPEGDVRAVVDAIQQVNGLRGTELAPGQVLLLP